MKPYSSVCQGSAGKLAYPSSFEPCSRLEAVRRLPGAAPRCGASRRVSGFGAPGTRGAGPRPPGRWFRGPADAQASPLRSALNTRPAFALPSIRSWAHHKVGARVRRLRTDPRVAGRRLYGRGGGETLSGRRILFILGRIDSASSTVSSETPLGPIFWMESSNGIDQKSLDCKRAIALAS